MRQWRLIYDSPTLGAVNMARDEAVLNAVSNGIVLPTLRLYAWTPPCLSLGYAQKMDDVDRNRLSTLGWGIVRRPTGGRTILHTDELTYSLALPADHPLAAGGVVESYRRISAGLLRALESLGAAVSAERKDGRGGVAGAVCFEVASHYEITVGGKKLVGSAQLRRKNGILQHGSLPLHGDIARICDALAYPDASAREAAKAQVLARAITLRDALGGRMVSFLQAADAVAAGFAQTFEIEFERGTLTGEEQAEAESLTESRYRI